MSNEIDENALTLPYLDEDAIDENRMLSNTDSVVSEEENNRNMVRRNAGIQLGVRRRDEYDSIPNERKGKKGKKVKKQLAFGKYKTKKIKTIKNKTKKKKKANKTKSKKVKK